MPSPYPKNPATRQRRNRHTTNAQLQFDANVDNVAPELPPLSDEDGLPVNWHPMVREWWGSVWRSPMASEYLDADMRGGLYQLAALHQDFWTAASPSARRNTAAEIRLQEVRFGLSPIDRRRLQWSIEQGETAAERTAARKVRKAPTDAAKADPRAMLRVS